MTDAPSGGKLPPFTPLESEPSVMSTFLHNLGLTKDLEFHDVLSLDDEDLLAFIPQPVHALVLCFDPKDSDINQGVSDENVIWIKQRIGNACGSMALLHASLNGYPSAYLDGSSPLASFKQQMPSMDGISRAELIESSKELRAQNQASARDGQSVAPDAEQHMDLHYISLVRGENGFLYLLDGRQNGPIKLVKLDDQESLLGSKTIGEVKKMMANNKDLEFSIVALAPRLL